MSKTKSENRSGPRILISRLSAIGDAILTLPVACALRAEFPDAYLGWVVERKAAPMVRGHRALDTVIQLDRKWFVSPSGIQTARSLLRPHQFDISIDCQGNTKSALAGWNCCRHSACILRRFNGTCPFPMHRSCGPRDGDAPLQLRD